MPSSTPAGIFTASVLCFLIRPCAVAGGAGLGNDLAAAVAVRAGLLDGEEALRMRTLPWPWQVVQVFGLVPGLAPVPLQVSQFSQRGNADLRLLAARRLLERDLEVVAQVAAAVDLLAAARRGRGRAEDVAEDVAERLGEAAEALGAAAAAQVRVDAGVAVLVVGRALLRVGQHLVGFLRLLELLLGRLGRRGLRSGWCFIASLR